MSHHSIPPELLSDETGQPFESCIICGQELLHSDVPYAVEKAMRRMDDGRVVTLFELAICMPCGQLMNSRMSKSSRKVMEAYFYEIGLMEKRMALASEDWKSEWSNQCVITRKPKTDMTEFHLIGNFVGTEPIESAPPILLNSELLEKVQEDLSPETKEELDNFRDTFLAPSDPQLRRLLAETPAILV
jgi:hypothetical protein